MIKDTIKESGRYDEIMDILNHIITDNEVSYPLHSPVCIDDAEPGKYEWRLNGDDVRKEAQDLMTSIQEDTMESKGIDDFNIIRHYIKDNAEILMINYAVHCAHRTPPSKDELEKIRSYLIIDNLLITLDLHRNGECEFPWSIPDGWKKDK